MSIVFEWHEEKAKKNSKKHKVSFLEAVTIFHDPFIATMPDPDHSIHEDRYIAIGRSTRGQLLVVMYTERDEKTRLISCRKSEPSERRIYEESN